MKTPIQPIIIDEHGTARFKVNKLVEYLLDHGGLDMNDLATVECSIEDREQFAQLIGYSVSGFGTLSYVTDETYNVAFKMMSTDWTQETAIDVVRTDMMNNVRKIS